MNLLGTSPVGTFMIDTLIWTAALIALVLVLRRPVGRWLGPQAAYALWALPLLRLILPPIVLPAWMRPASDASAAQTAVASPSVDLGAALDADPAAIPDLLPVMGQGATQSAAIDLSLITLGVWLIGAAIFVALRFRSYFTMRKVLLADAVDVGEAERVRLVESPCTTAPVAFGVKDKVVALPMGFMAHFDRASRDLALEHELAHHRGHDLAVNMIAQPLFALHWFNPLGWAGWRAMRRDQEAACDARVVADSDRAMRAAYAEVIASFATGPRVALAAPMACPVLGDKSIVHRLRSLTMPDVSMRRRIAGRVLLAAGAFALPLTASISYAEVAPRPIPAFADAPTTAESIRHYALAPESPGRVRLFAASEPPEAPEALEAPEAPKAPEAPDAPGASQEVVSMEFADADAGMESGKPMVMMYRHESADPGGTIVKIVERSIVATDTSMTSQERDRIMHEVERAMAEARHDLDEARSEIHAALAQVNAQNKVGTSTVALRCKDKAPSAQAADNHQAAPLVICHSAIIAEAALGLREARDEIAQSDGIPVEMREQVLETLDERIRRLEQGRDAGHPI